MMSMQLITEPVLEPVTLDDAKLFLRLDTADDDPVVITMAVASRRLVEQATRNCLLQQTWRFGFDGWPVCGQVRLPLAPLMSLTAVTVLDATGVRQPQALSNFSINGSGGASTIQVNGKPPIPAASTGGIQIDAMLGYGTSALAVPQPLRMAVLLILNRLYEMRGLDDSSIPAAAQALIAPYVRRAL